MDMSKYGRGFVSVDDVRDGPRTEKIVEVIINEKFDCPELVFESGDTLVLFSANQRAMRRAYGTNSNDWLQTVQLGLGHYVDNKDGQEKETVVLKPISVRQPSADNGGNKASLRPARRDDFEEEAPF